LLAFSLLVAPLAAGCGGGSKAPVTVTVTGPTTSAGTTTSKPTKPAVVPSEARARAATIKEAIQEHDNFGLKDRFTKSDEHWQTSCVALTRKLYRCDWQVRLISKGDNWATWSGKSKVQFYSLTTDTKLYLVHCSGLICA
jgi:hypothetical protein